VQIGEHLIIFTIDDVITIKRMLDKVILVNLTKAEERVIDELNKVIKFYE
jgi:hypothetical protein